MSMIKTQAASVLAITLGLGLASPVFATTAEGTETVASDASLSTAPLAVNGQLEATSDAAATDSSNANSTTSTTSDSTNTSSDTTQEDEQTTQK